MGTLNVSRIDEALRGTIFAGKLHHFETIDSTNTRALADAQAGAEAGQVYIADRQTAGRGRGGHTWHSAEDDGIYLSALLRPTLPVDAALKLSLAAGLAAREGVQLGMSEQVRACIAIDLRWPNDLVVAQEDGPSRKIGGVLTESASAAGGTLRHAVVGIGINLNQTAFPEDVAPTATSVRLVSGQVLSREPIVGAILQSLFLQVVLLEAEAAGTLPGTGMTVADRFEAVSSWVRGKRVTVSEDGGYTGSTDGLNEAGLLRVRSDDASLRLVRHGGVRELIP